MTLVGRLAAGKVGAFQGARLLKRNRTLVRQRVARRYRLLFRLEPGRLVLVDIIRRRDFERWLERHA